MKEKKTKKKKKRVASSTHSPHDTTSEKATIWDPQTCCALMWTRANLTSHVCQTVHPGDPELVLSAAHSSALLHPCRSRKSPGDLGAMWTLSQQLGSLRFRPASRRRWCCCSTDHTLNRPQIMLRQLSGILDKAPQHSGVTIPRPQTITLQEPLLVGVELGARITEQRKREPSKAVPG